jgi:hypothetical protein
MGHLQNASRSFLFFSVTGSAKIIKKVVNSRHKLCILTHMKIHLCRCALLAVAAGVLNLGWAYGADNTNTPSAQAPAAPGSAEQKNTKTQENNPPGPTTQVTKHPKEGTKKHKHKTHAPASAGVNQSGDKATKTPQKDTPPSMSNP